MSRFLALLALLACVALAYGCGGSSELPGPADSSAATGDAEPRWLAASHILIRFDGVAGAAGEIERTRDEARELAAGLARQARAGEAPFEQLALRYSEGPSAPAGGDLKVFHVASGAPPEFVEACSRLSPGQISDPVESEFGFHVIRRNALISVRQILILHQDSPLAPPDLARTPEQALEICGRLASRLESGVAFGQLAREESEGPAAINDGDLGRIGRGGGFPRFEQAAFALEVGETSPVVETRFGCHLIQRYE